MFAKRDTNRRVATGLWVAILATVTMPLWVAAEDNEPPVDASVDQLVAKFSYGSRASTDPSSNKLTADTKSKHAGGSIPQPRLHKVEEEPCATSKYGSDGRFAVDSCEPGLPDGYRIGKLFQRPLHNQGVCFDKIDSPPFAPTIYEVPDSRRPLLPKYPFPSDWTTELYVSRDVRWDQPASAAAAAYNGANDTNIVIKDDPAYQVATYDSYHKVWEGYGAWPWRSSAVKTVYDSRQQQQEPGYLLYLFDDGPYLSPATWPWSQVTHGYQKTVTWDWNIVVTSTGCTQGRYVKDENGDPVWECQATGTNRAFYTDTTYWHSEIVDTLGLPAGRDFSYYDTKLEKHVKALPPTKDYPGSKPPRCSGFLKGCESSFQRNTESAETPSTDPVPSRVSDRFPVFWRAWEMWGVHTKTVPPPGTDSVIAYLIDEKKVDWLDQTHSYYLSYYTCFAARNGRPWMSWEVAVPWPRQAPLDDEFNFIRVLGDTLEPPEPQTLFGWTNRDKPTIPEQESPPVHVPIPLFDVGSGITNDKEVAPDGNWWAAVRSTHRTVTDPSGDIEYLDCVPMGKVPVCLAETLRPWRAIWYIEPPPENVRNDFTPAPRDVRTCAYSDGETPLRDDQLRERRNPSPNAVPLKDYYQVVVDPPLPGQRAMMHTLPALSKTDRQRWVQEWLYGQGSSRNEGQDQQDPDRYCWYAWHQAKTTQTGSRASWRWNGSRLPTSESPLTAITTAMWQASTQGYPKTQTRRSSTLPSTTTARFRRTKASGTAENGSEQLCGIGTTPTRTHPVSLSSGWATKQPGRVFAM